MLRLFFATLIVCNLAFAAEDWKGKPPGAEFTLATTAGLGIIDSAAGFCVQGSAAYRVLEKGFVPDINNQLFVELQLGPLFVNRETTLFFSGHLRWDFVKDDQWTFFALGGLGGNSLPATFSSDRFRLYARFGLGAIYSVTDLVAFRGELSHEFIGVGLQFSI